MTQTATDIAVQTGTSSNCKENCKDIRLLVLDIDGTIAGVSNQVSDRVKQAIAEAQRQGVSVAIATGRMYRSALRFYREIGSTLPLIAYQGAWIADPTEDRRHGHWPLASEIALELLDEFDRPEVRSLFSVHCYIDDRLYVRELTPASRAYGDRTGVEPIAVGDLRSVVADSAPTKVLALGHEIEVISQLLDTFRRRYRGGELYLTQSHDYFLEAGNPQVNKGVAVRYLTEEILGLSAANVMAIGDNFNDLEMLDYAGIGVAMGNAPDAVRAVGDWLAPSVDRDGVAAAIEEFIL
ncbi:HAD family phosphatase [Oxynema sp. CENA135]|uniref:Cof-type HAD-IIB family hydrolase n=1 Tax=Oxynema sp. CENA135 TaxID=984206 RepID=UPI00190BAC35|nr:Cof-type HAD-IIB family hydrolase [Oxynema sp. CENA135]MBK4731805.1 HAD family phosphatase [Oxynema sp. CENA135]